MELHQVLLSALAKAVAESIPETVQKKVFEDALEEHLFGQMTGGDKSIFSRALNDAVYKMAERMLAEPENQEKIRKAISLAFNLTLEDGTLVRAIAGKLASSQRW